MLVFTLLAALAAASAAGCQGRTGAAASLRGAREISAGAPFAVAADADGVLDLRIAHAGLPDYEMRIESAPKGAQVVLEGRPVAKTPCRVLMNGTQAGFFLDTFSVRVRFIAASGGGQSRTVEELFSRHDKIPAVLRFSPEGAKRTLRD